MPPERRTGPSYMRGGVVACPKRRHLEGENGRIGSTRRGCSCRFGPDVAPRCPSELT